MFANYFKIAIRNLGKNRIYAFINIFSLALGIAGCLLIMLFVRDEISFDTFHPDADRIYRLAVEENYGEGQQFMNTTSPIALGQLLQDNFPEIESFTRVAAISNIVQRGDQKFSERIHLVDPSFFTMFHFPVLRGEANEDLRSVIITQAMAEKYFENEDPIGQRIGIQLAQAPEDFIVSGIAQNVPINTSIRFDFLIPFGNSKSVWSERAHRSFTSVAPETYIQLPKQYDAANLAGKTPAIFKQMWGERYQEGMYIVHYQPMLDIHLNTDYPAGIEAISDPAYSYILSAIAILVLLIACINFVTLSLGRSIERAREVGMRKVIGAGRSQIIRQFWGEAILLSFLALLIGLVIAELFLPVFNDLAGKSLSLTYDAPVILYLAALMLTIGLLAGSYPAIVLSKFQPVEVLKGHLRIGSAGFLRQGLTVFQFALSIFLIAITIGMARQLTFLQEKNLGFDREQVVMLPTGLSSQEGIALFERLRNELNTHPSIAGITASAFAFGEGWANIGFEGEDGIYRNFNMNAVRPGYLDAMGMSLAAGRGFSDDISSDESGAIIINEAFAAEFGMQDPIGKQIPNSNYPHEVIGMVKDFNFRSLHSEVTPLALVINPRPIFQHSNDVSFATSPSPKVAIKIKAGEIAGGLDIIKSAWQEAAPNLEFNYAFLDESLDRQYRQEAHLGAIVKHATGFAILIASMGLFGLAALVVIRRRKEIGVRKVLGATTPGIAVNVTKDFIQLVLIAIAVASPAAYWAIDQWLQEFAFRIDIGMDIFLLAGIIAIVIALLTVSFHAVKAAFTNPVDSLRHE